MLTHRQRAVAHKPRLTRAECCAPIAAFLDDADNVAPSVVAEDSPLSDIVESMVPEFTSLTPHDRSLCVQRLLDCGRRHHAAVIAQQAQQQRQARLRLERQRSEAQRRVIAAAAAAKREENQPVTAPAVVRERKDTLITDPRVGMLAELQASVPVDMIPCIIDRFNGNMDDAAAFLLDPSAERKQEEYLAAQRQREEEERLKLEADALVRYLHRLACPPPRRCRPRRVLTRACAWLCQAAEEARRSVMKRYDEEVDTKHKRYKPKARLDNRDRKAMRKEVRGGVQSCPLASAQRSLLAFAEAVLPEQGGVHQGRQTVLRGRCVK